MKLIKKMKKGFTLVELVVVIAIIAILAGVSVGVYVGITSSAKKSADSQVVAQLNIKLRADSLLEGKNKTAMEAYEDAKEIGFDLLDMTPQFGTHYVWDEKNDLFAVMKDTEVVFEDATTPLIDKQWKRWIFTEEQPTDGRSWFFTGEQISNPLEVKAGFDAGFGSVANLTYKNSDEPKEVVIRTNGGTLTIGSSETIAKGQIWHHGFLNKAIVYTENNCFHTHGAIGNMDLKAGKAIAEENALIYLATAAPDVKIEEKDNGRIYIPEGTTQAEDGTGVPVSVAAQVNISPVEENVNLTYKDATKKGGNFYEIGNLAALEQFRDFVNSGFNFDGITVKMTADITLQDGWTPIGEGSRKAAINTKFGSEGWTYSGYVYKGEFDGGSHKIYNLNNKGYVPTTNCLGDDGTDLIYCYGFFSLVAGSANIHDIEFVNVDIDTSRYANEKDNVKGDCVAAAVGFSAGNVELKNIKVTGNSTIIGYSAVASIIGKSYNQDPAFSQKENYPSITVDNCESNAVVVCMKAHYAAGLVGDVDFSKFRECIITNNTFTGTVWTKANTSALNNAGIGIVDVDTTDHKNDFTHYGNVNNGVQKYGINGTTIDNCLFVDMSTATAIESTRNSD